MNGSFVLYLNGVQFDALGRLSALQPGLTIAMNHDSMNPSLALVLDLSSLSSLSLIRRV